MPSIRKWKLPKLRIMSKKCPRFFPMKPGICGVRDLLWLKDSAYPIKTYPYFEEVKEEKRVDPISTVAETMSKLKDDEMIWIQLLSQSDWRSDGE